MENENPEKKEINPCCENCGSKFIYLRIKNKEIVCRKCGHITKLKEEENING